jgi:uncharacterized protein YecT (DUF1311 family)
MKNLLILVLAGTLYLQGYHDKNCTHSMIQTEPPAIVSESALDSSIVEKCMDEVDLAAFKNVQRTECYVKEVLRLERILELTLKDLIQKSPPNSRQYLQDAEEAWSYSRDTWCNYVGNLPLAPLPLFNRQFCLAEETNKHIEKLNRTKEELNIIGN